MQKGKKFLSDLKLHSDYLKWKEELGRYETWEEACEDIIKCHIEKYGDKIKPYSDSALQSMKEKLVLASQRSLQYRNEQLKAHSSRLYNCTTGYVAYNRIFQEVFYLLLSGCGFGGGLLKPFVANISNIEKRTNGTKTFVIPDSIEGWSDSLGVLMSSYFVDKQPFPEYFGYEIKFDFSQIRKKGSFISGGFKAPGSEALQKSLEQIENLIENWLKIEGGKIRPILAFDILCFASNAVLSGGVRRSAMDMIIDENDDEMVNAKMGNWFENNPQRARSNNSILLKRDKVNKEQFEEIIKMNDGISDIGFVFANSYFDMFNPCFTGDMEILTSDGYKRFDDLNENQLYSMINGAGQEVNGYIKKTGIKNVIDLILSDGNKITCTPTHVLLNSEGIEIEAQNTLNEKLATFENNSFDSKFVNSPNNPPHVVEINQHNTKKVVYDFELDDLTHYGVINGIIAHNCFEISQLPILWDNTMDLENIKYEELYDFINKNNKLLGIQGCNLCEIAAEACMSKEKFYRACYDAAILGTLQAGWTSFPYLGDVSENIFKKEALLGVSITGWMNNPKLFNPELLQKGADIIRKTNEEVARLININTSARVACVKPSGNSSVILGTSSGIHPEHSQHYFRIMQLNKEAETAKWLNENMPFLLEESVWSENKSDYVVFIPIENSKDGLFKKDMTGLAHLEKIKLVQDNWVNYGTNKELCGYPNISHNVSCTVIIDNHEEVINYIWDNRNDFTAVSFISNTADREYNQAPFTTVNTLENIIEVHGKGSLFASGLIVDGLHHFKNNLWLACDSVLDKSIPVVGTREEVLLKKYWISCAKKFAKNYFKGDLKKMVYCLKDVHLFHKWEVINRQMREVDFNKILAKPTFKDVSDYAAQACSGGACEIRRV